MTIYQVRSIIPTGMNAISLSVESGFLIESETNSNLKVWDLLIQGFLIEQQISGSIELTVFISNDMQLNDLSGSRYITGPALDLVFSMLDLSIIKTKVSVLDLHTQKITFEIEENQAIDIIEILDTSLNIVEVL